MMNLTRKLALRFSERFRLSRFSLFMELLRPSKSDLILDIGSGYVGFFPKQYPYKNKLILLDRRLGEARYFKRKFPNSWTVVADAQYLPFRNNSIDIVFSNSVIEHVPNHKLFSKEVLRVFKKGYFIQTPNKLFPMDTHYLIPLFQFLPEFYQKWIYENMGGGMWKRKKDDRSYEPVYYIKAKEIKEIFPNCNILKERLGCLVKSFYIYEVCDILPGSGHDDDQKMLSRRQVNVLFIHGGSGKGISGAEYVLLDIIKAIDKTNFVSTVTVGGEGAFSRLLEKENIEHLIIPFERLFNEKKSWRGKVEFVIQLLLAIPKLIKEIEKREIDVVHTTTRGGHICGSIAGKMAGVKVIMHMHDLPQNGFLYTLLGIVCCDKIIAISNSVKKIFNQNKFLKRFIEEKIVVIHNGVNLKKFFIEQPSPRVLDEFKLRDSYPIVGIIGQIVKWKGQLDLIEAAIRVKRRFNNFKVLIVGDVQFFEEMEYIKKLKAYIQANNLSHEVIFTGQRDDISEVLSVCDILVSASHSEPFGLTIIEAMAKGKPVIATKAGGPEEIVVNGETGMLVTPQNSDELFRAIVSLASFRELREKYGSNGRKRAERYFDISFFKEKILYTYGEVVKESWGCALEYIIHNN